MKLKNLQLRNIAAIEKADIDFTADLDCLQTGEKANIFLIGGDTGSGKSAILDGISLALFKTTPRLQSVANTNKNSFTDAKGETVNINSIEQYTRLGISVDDECYSLVEFEGNDGKQYTARLTLGLYQGKRNKDGIRPIKNKKPKWEIKCGNGNWIEKDTGEIIYGAIGLNFEQFSRMAMLAQGQFANFLTGDKSQRESILEQLTNTSHFSRYGEAIKSLHKKANDNLKSIDTEYRTHSQHSIPPEEIESLNASRLELESERKKVEEDYCKVENSIRLVETYHTRQNSLKEYSRKLQELREYMKSEEFSAKKALVEQWDNTIEERTALKNLQTGRKTLNSALESNKVHVGTFHTLCSDLNAKREVVVKMEKESVEQEKWLKEKEPYREVFKNAKSLILQIGNFVKNTENAAKKSGTLTETLIRREKLQKEMEMAKEAEKLAANNVATKEEEIAAEKNRLQELDPAGLQKGITDAVSRKGSIAGLKENIGKYNESAEQLKTVEQQLLDQQQKQKTFEKITGEAQNTYNTARIDADNARNRFATMQNSVEEVLVNLRHKMQQENTPVCPLCGQQIDTLHIDDDFKKLVAPLEEEQKRCNMALEKAENMFAAASKEQSQMEGRIKATLQHKVALEEKISKDLIILLEQSSELGFGKILPDNGTLEKELEEIDRQRGELDAKIKEAQSIEKVIASLDKEKGILADTHRKREKDVLEIKTQLELNIHNANTLEEQIKALEEDAAKIKIELSASLATLELEWETDTDATIKKIEEESEEYSNMEHRYDRTCNNIEKARQEIGLIIQNRSKVLDLYPDWETETGAQMLQTNDADAQWLQLVSDTSVTKNAISTATEIIEKAKEILDKYCSLNNANEELLENLEKQTSNLPQIREYISQTEKEDKSNSDTIDQYNADITRIMGELGIDDTAKIPDLASLKGEKEELDTKKQQIAGNLGAIEQKLETNTQNSARLQQIKDELEKAEKDCRRWDTLNSLFGGNRFRTLVQTYILRPLLNNANIYLQKITDRYILTCTEENEQLSIFVADKYNKGQIRSATVLSGGERFMISLALSLALSSLNRQDMNVDILFIDEGFGTLDERSLNSVMSTLEKLQEIAGQSKRRVGIISHREELKERIPVQIEVIKHGEGRSHIQIRKK